MRKGWFDYYKDHNKIALSNILLHWPYLLKIIKLSKKKVLEIGCGPADHSVFLSYVKSKTLISLLDNDKKIIINLRKKLSKRISKFYICDITDKEDVLRQKFERDQFDLIYSQGLMEHFEKKEFQTILYNFLLFTKKFIFSVPSEIYPNRDFGNELLRSEKQLIEIMNPIKKIEFKIQRYFPDIGLRTKLIKIKKEKLSLLQSLKLIFFCSLHYLVEVRKSY